MSVVGSMCVCFFVCFFWGRDVLLYCLIRKCMCCILLYQWNAEIVLHKKYIESVHSDLCSFNDHKGKKQVMGIGGISFLFACFLITFQILKTCEIFLSLIR